MNKAILMGRLTKDPELRSTQNGTSVCSFTVAVDRNSKEKQTDFINCVAWRQTGEFISKYFSKGRMIAVVGEIQQRDYTDKAGNKRTVYEVVVNEAGFCGDKRQEANVDPDDDDEPLPF